MHAIRPIACFTIITALAIAAPSALAQAQGSREAASASSVKEVLGRLWARLRAATPRSQSVASAATVTAGLRGSEATESELKPYWRGDREQGPAAKAEREALEKAQSLADSGGYAEAAKAFDAFLQDHPASPLAANALFGAALARAALGDKAR